MSDYTKNALVDGAVSTGGTVVSSLLGQAFAGMDAKRSWKYTKKAMDYQNAINRQNWERENARQDWLLLNQQRLQKQALENAGYSTADPNGTGVTTAAINSLDSPSGGQFHSDAAQGSYLPTYQDLLQTKLVEAQVGNLEAEAEKKRLEARFQEIQNWLNETYGAEQWEASIKNIQEDTKKKIAETLYTDQQRLNSIELTAAQVKDINDRLDMDWQKLQPTLQLLAAQTYQAKMAGKASEAQAALSYQLVKESAQKIENLQKELGLTDAQIGVAVAQAQLLGQEKKKLGWDTVKSSTESDLAQFERDVAKSMGIEFYQAKKVAETILPIGTLGALFGRLVPTSAPVKITGFGR